MKRSRRMGVVSALFVSLLAGPVYAAGGVVVPRPLPRPDEAPGGPRKPVKVFILAGQSNMVGMGDIGGARPPYPSVFLSADPALLAGRMPVGASRKRGGCRWYWNGISAIRSHGVYRSVDPAAGRGAVVAVYPGAYDPTADYSKRTPAKETTVALGTVAEDLPALDGPSTRIASAFIDVPATGNYTVHVGFGASTYAVASLDGREVYRREPGGEPVVTKTTLEAGRRYPLRITYFRGGSAALWLKQVDLVGKGDLVTLTKKDGKFQYLVDDEGNWLARNDVFYADPRLFPDRPVSKLSVLSNNGKSIGPEVGFGWVMGTYLSEPVLLIKSSMGNRSLRFDFRPPSSGRTDPDNKYEGEEYRLMVEGVRETLDNIAGIVPGYAGQGYELAGFVWWQAHKDKGSPKEDYEKCLVNLINDLRKEFKAPNMPCVVATGGFGGYRLLNGPWKGVWEAQMAVGDPEQHPEFAGTVASVDTRDFWREVAESPRGQDYHYNRNPETYLLVGEAAGRAMVRLMGGEAQAIPKSDREASVAAEMAAEAAKTAPTMEQLVASRIALRPMVLDGLLSEFVASERNRPALQKLMSGPQAKPPELPAYLDDVLDDAVAYYQAAGVHDYDWEPFGLELKEATWDYFGFDLPDSPYTVKDKDHPDSGRQKAKKGKGADTGTAAFEEALPAGMENWSSPAFNAEQAGWKSGQAPFSMAVDERVPEALAWLAKYPLYPLKRTMPKTVCENDVMLMRRTFEFPPARDGYRYRVRVDGSIHDNSGEGFAVYINGKRLAEEQDGVTAWRRQGLRGSQVWAEFLEAFEGGKVTIAVANFPMRDYDPKRFIPILRPLSVWVEEMKLPTFSAEELVKAASTPPTDLSVGR